MTGVFVPSSLDSGLTDARNLCRARQQTSGESSNMAQRPLHVFKYMHIHEYMKVPPAPFFFFITLGLKLSDAKVYEP